MINYEATDEVLAKQRRDFELTIKLFRQDMDIKFNDLHEQGNEIIKTLYAMSQDMTIILSDLQCIKTLL